MYHVEGRRWFQKTYGITYNAVRIYKDGHLIKNLPIAYGWGDYYLQRAQKALAEFHPELAEKHDNGSPAISFWQWAEDHGTSYSVIDVARQRDL